MKNQIGEDIVYFGFRNKGNDNLSKSYGIILLLYVNSQILWQIKNQPGLDRTMPKKAIKTHLNQTWLVQNTAWNHKSGAKKENLGHNLSFV